MFKNILKKLFFTVIILIAMYKLTAHAQTGDTNPDRDYEYKNFNFYQNETDMDLVASAHSDVMNEFILFQNYPNPFSLLSVIKVSLGNDVYVRLFVTDLNGNLVNVLSDGIMEKGEHHIFFKPSEDLPENNYKCRMEIYSDANEMVYSAERIMTYLKGDNFVNRR